jgi:hypothetical protein
MYEHLTDRPFLSGVAKLFRENAYRAQDRDLRFCDFRPHVLHPNHILPVGDDIWITLLMTGELISLRSGLVLASDLGRPHDGIVAGDEFFLTDCASNRVIKYEFDADTMRLGLRIAEGEVTACKQQGFLRGLVVVGDTIFAGLSARRGASAEFRTARIVALDRKSLVPIDTWVVPDKLGRGVFSILDVSRSYASVSNMTRSCSKDNVSSCALKPNGN